MGRSRVWFGVLCAMALSASALSPLGASPPAGASAVAASDVAIGDARRQVPNDDGPKPLERSRFQHDAGQGDGAEQADGVQRNDAAELAAPSLGVGFVLAGVWLAPGVVGLDWDDVAGVSGYEMLVSDGGGWVLLVGDVPAAGVAARFEGSAARVGGLSEDAEGYWFAVRARSTHGVSLWSESVMVEVPGGAGGSGGVLFDPFTEPTLSGIDLERLRQAAATVTPGEADCAAVPALEVAGVAVVDPPADLDDPAAVLTVAEVVRIAGGCVVVEYAALEGRTVAQVRGLLAGEASVHAVGEPVRGVRVAHDDGAHSMHTGGHHDDGGGVQWHLPASTMAGLWDGWVDANPVTVAVLDTGVYGAHRDLDSRIVTGGLGLCHRVDPDGHGTHVAGIVAAESESATSVRQDTAGVAPEAMILPIRVLERDGCDASMGPTEAVASAVNAGARVINMSLIWGTGHQSRDDQNVGGIGIERDEHPDTFETALRAASMLGAVSVAAAGNCGSEEPIGGVPSWEANKCAGHNFDHAPAVYSHTGDVITVAAVNYDGTRRTSSTFNDFVDIAAPGSGILSTVPRLACETEDGDGNPIVGRWAPQGCGTNPADPSCIGSTPALHTSRSTDPGPCPARVAHKSGTSMAAPFVAGVVAHMINRHPAATAGQIRKALESTTIAPPVPRAAWTPPPLPAPQTPPPELMARGREGDDSLEYLDPDDSDDPFKKISTDPHAADGSHEPTLEYGRGIVDPAAAVSGLATVLTELLPSGDAGAFASLSAGARHTCGLRGNGVVQCWGEQAIRDSTPRWAFKSLSLSSPPTGRFVCGVRQFDEAVQCWGDLPDAITSPVAVPPGTGALPGRFEQVAAGDRHVCGLRPNGGVVCWGDNSDGQTEVPFDRFGAEPDDRAASIVAGAAHTCAVTASSDLVCWGDDGEGQLPPATLPWAVAEVAAGAVHTCVVNVNSNVACWGDDAHDQLDAPGGELAGIASGAHHTCARDADDDSVACWGRNSLGQTDAPAGRFDQASAGESHTCALDRLGSVTCWGDDTYGQAPSSFVGRLGSLSLTVDGADLLAGRFDPAVRDYTVAAEPGPATLRVATDTADGSHSRIVATAGGVTSLPLSQSLSVGLAAGREFTVVVGAAFGQVGLRAYTVRVVAPPRLASLRLVPSGSGPHCVPQCPALELIPSFDPATNRYRVVAASDVSELTVEYRSGGGTVKVEPVDADPLRGGHQVALSTDRGFVSVSAGYGHTCGVKSGGAVVCWGDDVAGESDAPSGSFTAVSAGGSHSCGLKTDGTAACWGDDTHGQSAAPTGSFSAVSAGGSHSCGVKTDGAVVCWGDDTHGQSVAPSGSFSAVSAGGSHSCGVKTDGAVVCWGDDTHGQSVAPSGSFSAVSAGGSHSCGVKTDGTVVCWGSDSRGQVSAAPSGSFGSVSAGDEHSCGATSGGAVACWGHPDGGTAAPSGSVMSVTAGDRHSCAVASGGMAVCWGYDSYGQVSAPAGAFGSASAGSWHSCGVKTDGAAACWGFPDGRASAPSGLFGSVSAGWWHSCGVKTDGTAACWGSDLLGRASPPAGSFLSVSADRLHSCGVKTDATVACWGHNGDSQTDAPSGSFGSVSAGGFHTCGVRTDATVACWGWNGDGRASPPAGSFSSVSAGGFHSCGVRTDATVACWGYDDDGRASPPAGSFSSVSAGTWHTCGVRTDATVECWGWNGSGQSDAPSGSFSSVSAGGRHSCGVRTDSSVVCWGERFAELEPAASAQVTLSVAGRTPAVTPTLYTVAVQRPRPAFDRATTSAVSAARATGARSRSAGIPQPTGCTAAASPCHTGSSSPAAAPAGAATKEQTLGADPAGPSNGVQPDRIRADGAAAARSPMVCPAAPAVSDQAVTVADPVLRAVVLRAVGKDLGEATTAGDLAGLTALRSPALGDGPRVSSLSGLEHAAGLVSLDLTGHGVSDIAPLGCLGGLEALELGGNSIADLTALGNLTGLTALGISSNRVADVSALTSLTALEALDVSHNQVGSVSALSGLTALKRLNAGGNQISDISPLARLTSLEALYAYDNDIASLVGLSALSGLVELYVDHNAIADITPLSALRGLKVLGLGDNEVADLGAVSGLRGLEALYAYDNGIAALPPLSALTALGTLWASGNGLTDVSAVGPLAGLGYTDMRWNRASDVSALDALGGVVHAVPQQDDVAVFFDGALAQAVRAAVGLTGGQTVTKARLGELKTLTYVGSDTAGRIRDLRGLEHASSLAELRLADNRVRGIAPLAGLGSLVALDLQQNGFADLEQLAPLRALKLLGLIGNGIDTLDALPTMPRLEKLYLDINRIDDISPLAGFAGLDRLTLSANRIADIAPLAALSRLDTLTLSVNPLEGIDALASLSGLHYLRIDRTRTTDLAPLASMSRLIELYAGDNLITTVEPLAALTDLRTLHIARNRITDFTPLDTLTGLTVHGRNEQTRQPAD
ncbi:MAG: leucine-rich repeat domain-containing protein [Acidimicrobiaceae bacterium]|nr:leucine-rich repeat domain-containing protein [Acidimicrobiaceae bacterium]